MQLTLLVVGKTDSKHIEELMQHYAARLKHYLPFELKVIPDLKRGRLGEAQQCLEEGRELLRQVQPGDRLWLFDERGDQLTSRAFAQRIEQVMISGERRLILAIGGPYGFSEEVYARAQGLVGLSKMTFSHQMVRLFALEQLYRAQTILRGEPYHHD